MILLFIFGYFGNMATLVVLKFEKRLRPFTKTLLSMETFWDTMYLMLPGVLNFINIWNNMAIKNDLNFFIYINSGQFTGKCSIWHLSFVSLERMCLVVWPSNPIFRNASYREAFIISFLITLLALGLGILAYFFNTLYLLSHYFLILFRIAIPFVIISSSSFIILYKIKMDAKRIRPNLNVQVNQPSLLAIKMVIVVSSYYFTTTMTLFIFSLTKKYFTSWKPTSDYYERIEDHFIGFFITSTYSIKFYLYTISIPHIRKGFVKICKKMLDKLMNNGNTKIKPIVIVGHVQKR